eukprot:5875931-Prymnesium_polylepis.1
MLDAPSICEKNGAGSARVSEARLALCARRSRFVCEVRDRAAVAPRASRVIACSLMIAAAHSLPMAAICQPPTTGDATRGR